MRIREAITYASISLATLSGCGEYKTDQATCPADSVANSTDACNPDATTPDTGREQTTSEAITDTVLLLVAGVALAGTGLLIKGPSNHRRR